MNNSLIIIGAGGFGREVLYASSYSISSSHPPLFVLGFIDEDVSKHGQTLCDSYKVFGDLSYLSTVPTGTNLVFGLGSPTVKKGLLKKISVAFPFPIIQHSSVQMSRWVEVGEGTVLTAGCILTTQIKVGKHVNLNLDCTVGHDSIIGDFCNISPGCHISGHVTLEEGVDIGTGVNILPGLTIGRWSIIGAGATVTKDIPAYSVAVGVPAKVIKELPHDD